MSYRVLTCFVVFLASVYASVGFAECTMDPAMTSHGSRPCYIYGRLKDNDALGDYHDTVYFPLAERSKTSSGVKNVDVFIAECQPTMPLYLPYRDPAVTVTTGFVNPENLGSTIQGGIDYAKADGTTFPIFAAAAGRVLWVGYHPGYGNVIIIEHTPVEGYIFRTIYHHLRGGRDHDIDLSRHTKAFVEASQGAWAWDTAAQNYQDLGDRAAAIVGAGTNDGWLEKTFGTNDERLLVSAGQSVAAGQQIGWAGSTGLNAGSTHLHFMIARETAWYGKEEPLPQQRWVLFDPYGIYGGADALSCYNSSTGARNTNQHSSFFAPLFQDFIDVTVATFQKAHLYFCQFHYYPVTLSISSAVQDHVSVTPPSAHIHIDDLSVSGAFRRSPSTGAVQILRNLEEQQLDVSRYLQENLLPKSITTASRQAAPVRFSTVYGPKDACVQEAKHHMTAATFDKEFGDHYADRYELVSHSVYVEKGQRYFCGIWEKPAQWHHHTVHYDLTREELGELIEKYQAKKLRPIEICKYEYPVGTEHYSVLWHYVPSEEDFQYAIDIPAEAFYPLRDSMATKGLQMSYINSFRGLYTVMFRKPATTARLAPQPTPATVSWETVLEKNGLHDLSTLEISHGETLSLPTQTPPSSPLAPSEETPKTTPFLEQPTPQEHLFTPDIPTPLEQPLELPQPQNVPEPPLPAMPETPPETLTPPPTEPPTQEP